MALRPYLSTFVIAGAAIYLAALVVVFSLKESFCTFQIMFMYRPWKPDPSAFQELSVQRKTSLI